MKCNVIQSLNKRELQSFNGDEKFNDMLKRKAAIELAKYILDQMDYKLVNVETNESDEAEITEILFSVNIFSDAELWKYKEDITLDTLKLVHRLERT